MENIFSVDVEDWYHLNFSSLRTDQTNRENRVEENLYKLLKLFNQYESKATFFFLGSVAEQLPSLVREVASEGHEIASHGYGHYLVYKQSKKEFYDDVSRAHDILQSLTNQKIIGYRAPSWSISKQTPWAYDILANMGYRYDASLFPVKTYLYGDNNSPTQIHKIQLKDSELFEFPLSVLEISRFRIPFSGGFFLRFLPYWMINSFIHLYNKREIPVIYYIHPREFDINQPRMKLSHFEYFIAYYGLSSTEVKIKKILEQGPTITFMELLHKNESGNFPLKIQEISDRKL